MITSDATLVSVFDSCQADCIIPLVLLVVAVGLQVAGAEPPLVLLLPHPPLLRLPADGSPQPLLFFLDKHTSNELRDEKNPQTPQENLVSIILVFYCSFLHSGVKAANILPCFVICQLQQATPMVWNSCLKHQNITVFHKS